VRCYLSQASYWQPPYWPGNHLQLITLPLPKAGMMSQEVRQKATSTGLPTCRASRILWDSRMSASFQFISPSYNVPSAELHDLIAPHAARLCHTPNAHNRVAVLVVILSALLALVVFLPPFLPIRAIFFLFGFTPLINHPLVRSSIAAHHPFLEAQLKAWHARVEQWLDDDSLIDAQLSGLAT
jgi:hypothetical protein